MNKPKPTSIPVIVDMLTHHTPYAPMALAHGFFSPEAEAERRAVDAELARRAALEVRA